MKKHASALLYIIILGGGKMKKKEFIPCELTIIYYYSADILMNSGQSSDFIPENSYDSESWMGF